VSYVATRTRSCLNTLSGGQPLGRAATHAILLAGDCLNTLSGGQPLGRTESPKVGKTPEPSQYPLRWAASWQNCRNLDELHILWSQYPLRWAASWQVPNGGLNCRIH